MAEVDRLRGSDLLMLQSEEAGWPMHIGVVAVLDTTSSADGGALVDAGGRFDIEAARRAVGRRLDRVPRFRQVLHVPPRLLGPAIRAMSSQRFVDWSFGHYLKIAPPSFAGEPSPRPAGKRIPAAA